MKEIYIVLAIDHDTNETRPFGAFSWYSDALEKMKELEASYAPEAVSFKVCASSFMTAKLVDKHLKFIICDVCGYKIDAMKISQITGDHRCPSCRSAIRISK